MEVLGSLKERESGKSRAANQASVPARGEGTSAGGQER